MVLHTLSLHHSTKKVAGSLNFWIKPVLLAEAIDYDVEKMWSKDK